MFIYICGVRKNLPSHINSVVRIWIVTSSSMTLKCIPINSKAIHLNIKDFYEKETSHFQRSNVVEWSERNKCNFWAAMRLLYSIQPPSRSFLPETASWQTMKEINHRTAFRHPMFWHFRARTPLLRCEWRD